MGWGQDAMEPGGGDRGWTEDFVEVFALVCGWICQGAEGGDAVERWWAGVVGFRGCGENCCWDATVEIEGLWIELPWGGEKGDVQIHVGDFWRWVHRSRGEAELCKLNRGCEDYGVVNSEVDTTRVGRRERVDSVAAVRSTVDIRNAGIEQDLRPRSFEHAIKDLPIASLNRHSSIRSHADHALQPMYLVDILGIVHPCARLDDI